MGQFLDGMTLGQIQQEVVTLTKEPQPGNPVYATLANVTSFANEAQVKINSKCKCRIASNIPDNINSDPALMTVAGQRLYPLPADFMGIFLLSVNRIRMRPARLDEFARNVQWWRLPGFPSVYYFERNPNDNTYNFGLWLQPADTWPIGLSYLVQPLAMANVGDSPDLDVRLHPAIVHYVCEQVMKTRREFEKAAIWQQAYQVDLAEYMASGQDVEEPMEFLSVPVPSD